jgi:hypothetical protein
MRIKSVKSDPGYFCPCPAMRREPRPVPEGYLSYAEQMRRGRVNGAKSIRKAQREGVRRKREAKVNRP